MDQPESGSCKYIDDIRPGFQAVRNSIHYLFLCLWFSFHSFTFPNVFECQYLFSVDDRCITRRRIVNYPGGVLDVTGLNHFAPIGCTQLAYVVISMIAFLVVFVLDVGRFLPIARVTVFERIQDGVLVLDRDNKVVDFNPAAGQIIGHIGKAAVGRHISQVWPQGAYLLAIGPDARRAGTYCSGCGLNRPSMSKSRLYWMSIKK